MTKERILEVALDLIGRQGVRQTTIEAIASQAGVSHMTVHRHWKTKEDLVSAVVMRVGQEFFGAIDEEVRGLSTPQDKIVAGFTSMYWFTRTHPLFAQIFQQADSILSAVTVEGSSALEMTINYLAGHIARSAPLGSRASAQPRDLAEVLVRLTQSLMLTSNIDGPIKTRSGAEEYAHRIILPIVQAFTVTGSLGDIPSTTAR